MLQTWLRSLKENACRESQDKDRTYELQLYAVIECVEDLPKRHINAAYVTKALKEIAGRRR